jgi:hypothetical protein
MSTDPDRIRQEIERTREDLSSDVDALAYKASPSRMVQERRRRVSGAVHQVRDKIMGTAPQLSAVGDAASEAPARIRRTAEGNPLAAGLIAFGAGWLASSLLPASQREQQAATRAKTAVQEHTDTVKEEVGGVAQEVRDSLRQPAQDAAQSVRSKAEDAVQTVRGGDTRS